MTSNTSVRSPRPTLQCTLVLKPLHLLSTGSSSREELKHSEPFEPKTVTLTVGCVRNKTLELEALNNSNTLHHPAHETNSSSKRQTCSCRNSKIATHRAAAAEIHDKYLVYTNSERRTAAYSIITIYCIRSKHSELWNHTLCLTKRDGEKTLC